jgi:hypothetical protein
MKHVKGNCRDLFECIQAFSSKDLGGGKCRKETPAKNGRTVDR